MPKTIWHHGKHQKPQPDGWGFTSGPTTSKETGYSIYQNPIPVTDGFGASEQALSSSEVT
jgi:hypothetical protein